VIGHELFHAFKGVAPLKQTGLIPLPLASEVEQLGGDPGGHADGGRVAWA
jgi:hypothetical protein